MKISDHKRADRKSGNRPTCHESSAKRDSMRPKKKGWGEAISIDDGVCDREDPLLADIEEIAIAADVPVSSVRIENNTGVGEEVIYIEGTFCGYVDGWKEQGHVYNFISAMDADYEEMWDEVERRKVTIPKEIIGKGRGFITLEEARKNRNYEKLAGIDLNKV